MMLINHPQHQNGRSDSSFAAILQSNLSSVALWSGFSTQLLVHCNHCHHSLQTQIGIHVYYKITVTRNCKEKILGTFLTLLRPEHLISERWSLEGKSIARDKIFIFVAVSEKGRRFH